MKKKKLSLDALKVKSFVTSFDNKKENTVKGGDYPTHFDNQAPNCIWNQETRECTVYQDIDC